MPAPDLYPSQPQADYLAFRTEIDAAVLRVLARGHYVLGAEVAAFEQDFAAWLGLPHVIGVANGTDALALALQAVGVAPGDIVITVAHTAVATAAAITLAGASPLFVDIDPTTLTLCPLRLRACLREQFDRGDGARIRAVVPVHLYGQPAPMREILSLARDYDLRVVEDCAQAAGATLPEGPVGTLGDAAAFSFYPTKNLGATGDAGAVATRDPLIARRVRALRQYGWTDERLSTVQGRNSRLDDIQAAVLRVKLPALHAANARRRALAARYTAAFAGLTDPAPPAHTPGAESVFHQYVLRTARRDSLQAALHAAGVRTAIHYAVPAHLHPAYASDTTLVAAEGLPVTERAAREVLSLPLHAHLSEAAIDHAATSVKNWAASNSSR